MTWQSTAIAFAATTIVWATAVGMLAIAGRRTRARALAGFIPDCLVLFRRLLADPRVPKSRRTALALAAAYLAMPLDLVPDFIPVAGQVDDALVAALALRYLLGGASRSLVREHWPGPEESLRIVQRLSPEVQRRARSRAPRRSSRHPR